MKHRDEVEQPDIRRLTSADNQAFNAMLDLFAAAFEAHEHYSSERPQSNYRNALLARDDIVVLVGLVAHEVVGALVAYELRKFEQERSEFYIYDLAVAEQWRRRGVATGLIEKLKEIARTNRGWGVYVQADHGDDPALALYSKLGTREDVIHFDLPLE